MSADNIRKRLLKMANAFDPERGPEPDRRGTTAILDEADAISRRRMIGRILKGGKDDFVERYLNYYNASLRSMRDYAETRLMEKAYRLLLAEVDELIRVANGLFRDLEAIMEALNAAVADSETRHERSVVTENVIYVCADRLCKRSLWAEVEQAIAGQRLGVEVNKSIASEVYATARRNRIKRKDEGIKKLSTMFRATVVDGFAGERIVGDYASVHEMSLVGAVRKEAELTKTDPADLFRGLIAILNRQSDVMVTLSNPSDGQRIQFWALHPSLRGEMARFTDPDQLINASGQGNQAVEEPEFSIHEMQSVSLRVNLEMRHLAKLSPPLRGEGTSATDRSGRYYDEYLKMVTELIDAAEEKRVPRTITPHIHRDWHRPGLLPEISEMETQRVVANNNRSFAVGITFGLIVRGVDFGLRVAHVRTLGRISLGGIAIRIADSHDLFQIMEAFERQPEAVRGCLRFFDEVIERSRWEIDPTILDGVADPRHLVEILRMAEIRADGDRRDPRIVDVIAGYATVLHELIAATSPNFPPNVQVRTANERLTGIGSAAMAQIEAEGAMAENREHMRAVYARGLEAWRATTARRP